MQDLFLWWKAEVEFIPPVGTNSRALQWAFLGGFATQNMSVVVALPHMFGYLFNCFAAFVWGHSHIEPAGDNSVPVSLHRRKTQTFGCSEAGCGAGGRQRKRRRKTESQFFFHTRPSGDAYSVWGLNTAAGAAASLSDLKPARPRRNWCLTAAILYLILQMVINIFLLYEGKSIQEVM